MDFSKGHVHYALLKKHRVYELSPLLTGAVKFAKLKEKATVGLPEDCRINILSFLAPSGKFERRHVYMCDCLSICVCNNR